MRIQDSWVMKFTELRQLAFVVRSNSRASQACLLIPEERGSFVAPELPHHGCTRSGVFSSTFQG